MSYARHNGEDSQVYVIRTVMGNLECLGCRITGELSSDGLRYGYFKVDGDNEQGMIDHLLEHRRQGWRVPAYAIIRLEEERDS